MPRIRTIKPGFFANEQLADLSSDVQLLFIGLWTLADREGRLEDRPRRIKGELFRYREMDVDAALDQLQAAGFVRRYSAEGRDCIQVVNFDKHQRPNKNEVASELPAEQSKPTKRPIKNSRATTQGKGEQEQEGEKEQEQEQQGEGALIAHAVDGDDELEVFAYWQEVTAHEASKYTPKRKRAVKARLKDGYTVERLKRAIDGIKLSPHHQGKNDHGTIYDDLELICRDGEHVEKFERIANGHRPREPVKPKAPVEEMPRMTTEEYIALANKHEMEQTTGGTNA